MANQVININQGGSGSSSGGSLITNAIIIALLVDDTNWGGVSPNVYSGVDITGQKTGDYYDNGATRYYIRNTISATRIPYANL